MHAFSFLPPFANSLYNLNTLLNVFAHFLRTFTFMSWYSWFWTIFSVCKFVFVLNLFCLFRISITLRIKWYFIYVTQYIKRGILSTSDKDFWLMSRSFWYPLARTWPTRCIFCCTGSHIYPVVLLLFYKLCSCCTFKIMLSKLLILFVY